MPSLSVVQTVPSLRRNDAPALSSPPKPNEPSTRPSTNHLKPDRHLGQAPAEVASPRGRSSSSTRASCRRRRPRASRGGGAKR